MNYNVKEGIITLENEEGKVIAEVTFPEIEKGVVCIDHTFVDESLRGKGVASELIQMVADYAKKNKLLVKPSCSYAVKWFEKNTQFGELLFNKDTK